MHWPQRPKGFLWRGEDGGGAEEKEGAECEVAGTDREETPRSIVVKTSAKNIQEPNSRLITRAFLPIWPMPDCSASARSKIGPVST